MFACRVMIGEYCVGRKDAPAPDVRAGNTLYDTTVDFLPNPSIYVTYHDAQAYPEYHSLADLLNSLSLAQPAPSHIKASEQPLP